MQKVNLATVCTSTSTIQVFFGRLNCNMKYRYLEYIIYITHPRFLSANRRIHSPLSAMFQLCHYHQHFNYIIINIVSIMSSSTMLSFTPSHYSNIPVDPLFIPLFKTKSNFLISKYRDTLLIFISFFQDF